MPAEGHQSEKNSKPPQNRLKSRWRDPCRHRTMSSARTSHWQAQSRSERACEAPERREDRPLPPCMICTVKEVAIARAVRATDTTPHRDSSCIQPYPEPKQAAIHFVANARREIFAAAAQFASPASAWRRHRCEYAEHDHDMHGSMPRWWQARQ